MKRHLIVIILFIALTLLMTFPLCASFTSAIPGFSSTDEPFGALWDSWRIKFSMQNKLSLRHTDLIAYPYGMDNFRWGGGLIIGVAWNHLLAFIATPVVSWNIQLFINFVLCAFLMYLLVYYLTGNTQAGILSGILFAFSPYQFSRAWQHLGLTYNQCLVLILLASFLLKERLSRKRKAFFILSCILLASFDYSVTYMGTVALMSFMAYVCFYGWRSKIKDPLKRYTDFAFIRNFLILIFLTGAILFPQFLPLIKNRLTLSGSTEPSSFNAFHRPFEDLFEQSARPLSYLLPAVHHPALGAITGKFLGSGLYGRSLTEHTLYLGWTGLILAFFAFYSWRRNRAEEDKLHFFIGFFLFLGFVAWLFSQPPWWEIGGIRIFFPSFFMYKLLPMFRAYCRFGIVLMLSVAVLAGLQWHRILRTIGSPLVRAAMTAAVCGLALFEFWNWPPYKIIDVSRAPKAYAWLEAQPDDRVVAEYPLDIEAPNEMFKFYQTFHGKKIINGAFPETPAFESVQDLASLSDPATAVKLRARGVSYVIVHTDLYSVTGRMSDVQELERISSNPLLRLEASYPAQECVRGPELCTAASGPIHIYSINPETD